MTRWMLVACGLAAMGCGEECLPAQVSVQTTEDGRPSFDWPGGPVEWLNVGVQEEGHDVGVGEPIWHLECPDSEVDCIPSPIVYGQVPDGADETVPPGTLAEGVEHYVQGLLACTGNDPGVYANTTFVP